MLPPWLIAVNVVAVLATLPVVGFLFLRGGSAGKLIASTAAAVSAPADARALKLAEIGKALDLTDDLVAAGKTRDEANAMLLPILNVIWSGHGEVKPAV